MKHRNIRNFLLPLFVLSFAGACAVTERFEQNYQEATAVYPEPVDLDAAPQNTGLLLIDAVTKKALNTMPLSGVAIANLDDPETEITAGSFRSGGFLGQMSGVVVIPGLKPGPYRITRLRTQNANFWESLNMPETADFIIEVRANSPTYFGQVQIVHPVGTTDREIKIDYRKKREVEAWRKVSDRYAGSPWIANIAEHTRNLQ